MKALPHPLSAVQAAHEAVDAGPAGVAPVCVREAGAPRRFGGVARLVGGEAFVHIASAHVCVIGLGGVGSWAAEALARSGVGRLTLIDLDHVAESNINRQVLALDSTAGAAKVDVMAARVADIAPDCLVRAVDDFVTPGNVAQLVPPDALVIDAIDQVRAKAALAAHCVANGQRLVVCGGAGGRSDPLRLRRDDLARARGDALLASLRARLRREYGYPREAGRRFGIEVVYSDEPPARRTIGPNAGAALACAGYGSLITVTAAMGMAAASRALDALRTGTATTGTARAPAARAPSRDRSMSDAGTSAIGG